MIEGAPLSGTELVLDGPRLTLIGELHGTREVPAAMLALAQAGAARGPVRVGLELPVEEQACLDRFFDDGDRAHLLAGDFWSRGLRDGRNSAAMADLLAALRDLRAGGADIAVFPLDDAPTADDDSLEQAELCARREARMAARVEVALAAWPRARLFVLVGELHARTVRGNLLLGEDYGPLGAIVSERHPLTSLQLSYRAGTAWCCVMNPKLRCGPLPLTGRDRGDEARIILHARRDEAGYDGELYVANASASPPAVPET